MGGRCQTAAGPTAGSNRAWGAVDQLGVRRIL